jgi:hypothetical protein
MIKLTLLAIRSGKRLKLELEIHYLLISKPSEASTLALAVMHRDSQTRKWMKLKPS